jgi:hypothetical protein
MDTLHTHDFGVLQFVANMRQGDRLFDNEIRIASVYIDQRKERSEDLCCDKSNASRILRVKYHSTKISYNYAM